MRNLSIQEAMSFLPLVVAGKGVAIKDGQKARSKVFYIAGLGVELAGKDGQLIEQSTKKETGITNLDGGNKLNSGRYILVTAIRILFDTTAGVTPKTASWKGEAPGVFKNGDILIGTSAAGNIFDHPIAPLAKYASSLSVEQEFKQITPFMIMDKVEFTIKILLSGAAAVDQAYRVELDAIEITDENAG